jgi:hypothetical protein
MRSFISILIIALSLAACKKDKPTDIKQVEIYLLESYQLVPGKCQVDVSSASLKNSALVNNDDILWYSGKDHEYGLTSNAIQKINALSGRTPFALTLDKEIIFIGIYMPPIMSSTCDQSITLYVNTISNKAILSLGYPYGLQSGSSSISDQRNNPRLVNALFRQRKLK